MKHKIIFLKYVFVEDIPEDDELDREDEDEEDTSWMNSEDMQDFGK